MTLRSRHLVLRRPLAVIDLESTGTDPATDRVVEIAVLTLTPDGAPDLFTTRVNPGRPIPPTATAVHGIGDADARDAPTFAALAPELARRLVDCDLAGFGITGFDLPLLAAEFARAGVSFPLAGRAVLDALAVYRRYEARTLAAAVGFYLGRDHAGGVRARGADDRSAPRGQRGRRVPLPAPPGRTRSPRRRPGLNHPDAHGRQQGVQRGDTVRVTEVVS